MEKKYNSTDFKDNAYEYTNGDNFDPSEFPLEIFPNRIIQVIENAKKLDFPPQVFSGAIMFAASTAMGGNKTLRLKQGWEASGSMWIAIVGDSGSSKSHPVNFATKPLLKLEKGFHEDYTSSMSVYDPEKGHEKPVREHRYTTDTTVEGVTRHLEGNPWGIGQHKDELAGLFNSFGKYSTGSSNDKQFYLTAFDNKPYVVTRAGKEVAYINSLYIPQIGTIQNEVLRSLAQGKQSENVENGMIQRWLYILNPTVIGEFTFESISDGDETAYHNFIEDIYHRSKKDIGWQANRLHVNTTETGNAVAAGMNKLRKMRSKDSVDGRLASYISKMETYYPRLINLIAVMNNITLDVPAEIVYKADLLVDYFISSAKNAFVAMDNKSTYETIYYREKAKTAKEKIISLHKHLGSTLTDTEIASEVSKSKQYVGQVRRGEK